MTLITKRLHCSISKYKYKRLKSCLNNSNHYAYIIVNGERLKKILNKLDKLHYMGGTRFENLFQEFIDIIKYTGKGTQNRKVSHLQDLEK